jgi:hypothetical protein
MQRQPLELGREVAAIAEFYDPAGEASGARVRGAGTRASSIGAAAEAVGNLIENAIAPRAVSGDGDLYPGRGASIDLLIPVAASAPPTPHLFDRLTMSTLRGGGAGWVSIVKSIRR